MIYLKAEARSAVAPGPGPEAFAPEPAGLELGGEPGERWRLGLGLPLALGLAWAVVRSGVGRFLAHTFVAMWLHELGHAVTGWFCGLAAVPGPWRTAIPEERSAAMALLLASGLAWLGRVGQRARQPALVAAAAGLLGLQAAGTLLLPLHRAQALVTFGGDGGGLVLASLLMASFYLPVQGPPHWGELRAGLLGLGALAFMELARTWWAARADSDAIPYGEIEGVGLSDPSKLTELHAWTERQLVHRYLGLAGACLAALALLYAWRLARARR